MFTVTCLFTFPDGATASAAVTVPSPHSDARVKYTGAADRLPDRFEMCYSTVLPVWARRVARQTGATVTVSENGKYDWHAE
jgi:hypothetical protein